MEQQGDNKVLILAFFNTDCKSCEEDLRYLQRLYDQYGRDGLDVVCVFTGRSAKTRDRAKRFIQNLDLKLTVVLDENGKIAKGYNVTGIPCQYIVDREGFVRSKYLGCGDGVKRKIEEHLRTLLS